MTFPAELERLKRAADNGDIRASECAELIRNRADAILGLVRAAETNRHWHDSGKDDDCDICQALAKLNGEGK